MEQPTSDRELIAVMRQYFATKAELADLRSQLESARQETGDTIDVFYDIRGNVNYARDLQRMHSLKSEMGSLMQRAEAWGRAQLAPDRLNQSTTHSTAEEKVIPLFNDPNT